MSINIKKIKEIVEVTDVVSRTEALERGMLDVDLLDPNPLNPNEMSEREFNLLYDNIGKMGVTDPILVCPNPEKPDRYRIVGGKHRWEAAKLHGMNKVPCTIVRDPNFTADEEAFQLVRHNIIKGKMSPQKFVALYESLANKYAEEIAAELFGFQSEEDFKKLITATVKTLPNEMKEAFKEAAKEVKTIEGLAALLNRMFSEYGDTLSYGYMIVDYGKKNSIWLRMEDHQLKHFLSLASMCRMANRSVDGFFSTFLQSFANGDQDGMMAKIISQTPVIVIPATADKDQIVNLDYLDKLNG